MVDLTPFNTLRIPAKADNLIDLDSVSQVQDLISQAAFSTPFLIIGHGANILFTRDFPGNIYKVNFSGIEVLSEDAESVLVQAAAGQDWHEFVMWSVAKNLSGLENMALIPGTVGAAVIGNIAAYGQNQECILQSVDTLDLYSGQQKTWDISDCKFTYRESIFKQKEYKKYLIISAIYRLSKETKTDTTYHATRHASLLQELERMRTLNMHLGDADVSAFLTQPSQTSAPGPASRKKAGIESPTYSVQEIAQAVINLRTAKLPDWTQVGTAGSFFKNPVIPKSLAETIKAKIPDLQIYPADKLTYTNPADSENYVKVPAGMLLDELGWKGKTIGHVSTYPSHALVVINNGGTGQEVYDFAEQMRSSVKSAYGIDLEYEVVII